MAGSRAEPAAPEAEAATEAPARIVEGPGGALGGSATPASILALQRAAGNAAVGRALARQVLQRKPTKAEAKAKSGAGPPVLWATPTKRASADELAAELDIALRSAPENLATTGLWMHLVISGGRMHVYDTDVKPLGTFRLKSNARLPGDGYYLSALALVPGKDGGAPTARWISSKLGVSPISDDDVWMPQGFGGKTDGKLRDVMINDWVVDADRAALEKAIGPDDPTRMGMVVAGYGTESSASKASKQIARVRALLAKKGKGKGAGPGEDKTKGADPSPEPKDAQPPKPKDQPDSIAVIEDKRGIHVRITVDGARQDLEFREGESDAKLAERIEKATAKVRDEIDPSKSTRIEKGATETQIDKKPGVGGVAVPDGFPITPDGRTPNAPGYDAVIISHGPGGRSGKEHTVLGATLNFTMELDYAGGSLGFQDEVFNRMQPVAYKWELINVDKLDLDQIKAKLKGPGSETDSGIARDLARDLANTWEDTENDLADVRANPALAAYLQVVAISDLIQVGGALISSFFSIISQPLNERSIGFNDKGDYILRCFAQPVVDDDTVEKITAKGRTPVIRAPSAAVVSVRVAPINERAKEVNDAEQTKIDQLRKQLDDPPFPYTREDVQKQLDAAIAALGDNNIQAIDKQIKGADEELGRITAWRDADLKALPLDSRNDDLRLWKAMLTSQGVELGPYEKQMQEMRDKLVEARKRYVGFGLRGVKDREKVFRPRMSLALGGQRPGVLDHRQPRRGGDVARGPPRVAADRRHERGDPGHLRGRRADAHRCDPQRVRPLPRRQRLRPRLARRQPPDRAAQGGDGRDRHAPAGRDPRAAGLGGARAQAAAGPRHGDGDRRHDRRRPGRRGDRRGRRRRGRRGGGAEHAPPRGGRAAEAVGLPDRHGHPRRRRRGRRGGRGRGARRGEARRGGCGRGAGAPARQGGAGAADDRQARGVDGRGAPHRRQGHDARPVDHHPGLALRRARGDRQGGGERPEPEQGQVPRQAARGALEGGEERARAGADDADGGQPRGRLGSVPRPQDDDGQAAHARRAAAAAGRRAARQAGRRAALKPQTGEPPVRPSTTEPPVKPQTADTPGQPPPKGPPHEPPSAPPTPRRPPSSAGEPTIYATDRPRPISAANMKGWMREALGRGNEPHPELIVLVDPALIDAIWNRASPAKPMPEGSVGYFDPDPGRLYLSKPAFMESPHLQQLAFDAVMGHMNPRGRAALPEQVARAVGELGLQAAIDGAPPVDAASAQGRALQQRLATVLGPDTLNRLLFRGEVNAFRSKLAEAYGSARGNAVEAALRSGDVGLAMRLAGEPDHAMSNAFGELLAVATSDLHARQAGGKPIDPKRAALADRLAGLVGQDVLDAAYFGGRTEPLRAALERALGPDGVRQLVEALRTGDVAGAGTALSVKPPPEAPRTAPKEERPPAGPERPTTPEAPAPKPKPKEVQPLGPKANDLRAALDANPDPKAAHESALDAIVETGSFKELRAQVAAEMFGPQKRAQEAIQQARRAVVDGVLAEIKRVIEAKYPGVEIRFSDLGTPGFASDRDITIKASGNAKTADLIAASVEGVRAAYDVLNGNPPGPGADPFAGARAKTGGRKLPPDRVLDSNFYTELHEGSVTPRTPEERLGVIEDQSVVSLTELRANMHDGAEWTAYRERLLKTFEDSGADPTGTEAQLNRFAANRLKQQLDAAERLYTELHPPGKTSEQVLGEVQQQLLDALAAGAPPREIRALQARIKLLEPDAYGTRAAVVGVVDQSQGAARAETRQQAWEKLSTGKEPMTPRELAATSAQEAAASAGKLRHAAPDTGATTAQAVSAAKYLARVWDGFRKAGLSMQHPLLDRTGEIIGSKQEANAQKAAMAELHRWAEDHNRLGLDDQGVRDAFVREVKALGEQLDQRLRRNEAIQAGMDPTPAELAALKPDAGGGGGQKPPPKEPPKDPSGGGPSGPPPPKKTPPPAKAPKDPGLARFKDAAQVRSEVAASLARLQGGHDEAGFPRHYRTAMELLAKSKNPVNKKLIKLLPIVEKGLRNPDLYAHVLADAWEIAITQGVSINHALVQMAKEGGVKTKVIPKNAGALSGKVFFDEHVTRNARIIDKGIGADHGVYTHLLQDLVVDRALRAAGRSENGLEFRQLLARAEGMHNGSVPVGDLIWRVTYDTEDMGHINTPEDLREALATFGLR